MVTTHINSLYLVMYCSSVNVPNEADTVCVVVTGLLSLKGVAQVLESFQYTQCFLWSLYLATSVSSLREFIQLRMLDKFLLACLNVMALIGGFNWSCVWDT